MTKQIVAYLNPFISAAAAGLAGWLAATKLGLQIGPSEISQALTFAVTFVVTFAGHFLAVHHILIGKYVQTAEKALQDVSRPAPLTAAPTPPAPPAQAA